MKYVHPPLHITICYYVLGDYFSSFYAKKIEFPKIILILLLSFTCILGTSQNTPFPTTTSSNNVGIGTTNPFARFHIADGNNTTTGSSVLFEGVVGSTPISGPGTRFMWIPEKSAFRVGSVSNTLFYQGQTINLGQGDDFWDDAEIGDYSFASGFNNKASGLGSHSLGVINIADGEFSYAFGFGNSVNSNSMSLGFNNTLNDDLNFAIGSDNSLTNQNSFSVGRNNIVSNGSMAFGRFLNVFNGAIAIGNSNAGITSGNPAIEFGIGANKNGLTLYQDGKVQFNELPGTGNALSIDANGFLTKTANSGLWNEETSTHISYQDDVTIGNVEPYRPANTNLWVNGISHTNGITVNNPSPSAWFNDETQKLALNTFGNQSWISFSGTDLSNNNGNGLSFLFSDANNNYTNIMKLKHDGNVGIGTENPTRKLHINGSAYFNSFDGNLVVDGNETINGKLSINSNLIQQLEIVSTAGNPQAIQLTDGTNSTILSSNNGNAALIAPNDVTIWNGGKFTVQNNGFETRFLSSRVVIGSNEMTFSPDQNAKLHVDGKAVFKEAVVRPDGWSDFVFDEDYKLLPLEDVKAFIQENKHLPDVPSEKQVIEEGVSVGKMDAILLQKIEELTLYVLQLEEEISKLKTK